MLSSVLLFLNIGSSEMILIVFVALLLFGGEKLPEIARGLGKGIRDFKDASEGVKREINNQINSFEGKREDKLIEENIIASKAAAAEKDKLIEDVNAVPNTIAYNENALVEDPNFAVHSGTNIDTDNNFNNKPADNFAVNQHETVPAETKHTI